MAARSSSNRARSSRGRSSGSRSSRGGGGGNSQGPMMIAIVLVVGAVGAFVMFGGGSKKKSGTPVPADNGPVVDKPAKPAEPEGPTELPPPKINNDTMSQARAIVKDIKLEYTAASNLYDDAQLVKDDDQDQWQAMLREANTHMGAIQDLWNEVIGMMPNNADWDEERTADHWLGRDYQKVGKIDQLRMAIRKNIRSK